MKKILITGAQSYVGMSFEQYVSRWPEDYQVDTVDMRGEDWKQTSFAGYDAVFHVAGLVHMPKTKNSEEYADIYKKINTDLVVETARKAKDAGVKQFIFMSSASVYGLEGAVGTKVTITEDTPLEPADNYGVSKKNAEMQLLPLEDDSFKIVILRPPMIYGKGCRGNYVTLAKLAKKLPVFPYMHNQRSMLYIDNLSEFVRLMIDNEEQGIFCPQNNEYTQTAQMVRLIAKANGRKIWVIHGFGWALKLMSHLTGLVNKAFGNLCYDFELSRYKQEYCVVDLETSIMETER